MQPPREHSPRRARASNGARPDDPCPAPGSDESLAWSRLRRACRELRGVRSRSASVDRLLELALDSTGFERAFVVRRDSPGDPAIVAALPRRADRRERPSREVLRRALGTSRACSALALDGRQVAGSGSLRSLKLRSVWTVPIEPSSAALVFDSQRPVLPSTGGWLAELLEAFAGLVACVVDAADTPRGPSTAGEHRSAAFRRMTRWMRRVASSELPVFVHGESGTGKERVAREIHRHSSRRGGPFVAVNCSALPESLMEAELFGAVRGAYTGSDRDRPGLFGEADGGTLFLDEVADTPLAMQAKLLRALQERRVRAVGATRERGVDVRVVSASHRDPARSVADGTFRADLYFRLAVLRIDVPPLRERLEDLDELVDELLVRLATETGFKPRGVSPEALRHLARHSWPGNVRELHAVLAHALLRADGGRIEPAHLAGRIGARTAPATAEDLETRMIREALVAARGVVARAARSIGWTRQKLYRRMAALGIERPEREARPRSGGGRAPAGTDAQSERGTTSSESSTFQ